ncbi:MAG TPA: hypothetical protein DCM45_00805, partial [Clostridiales bacterium]|nr:hypothetical protein [Clostridiales bacterium]
ALCPAIDMSNMGGCGKLWERAFTSIMFKIMVRRVLGTNKPTRDQYWQTNPTNFLTDGIVPIYLQHGDRDPGVSVQQSIDFADAASSHLKPEDLCLDIMPGAAHAGAGPEFFLPEHIIPIFEFFKMRVVSDT